MIGSIPGRSCSSIAHNCSRRPMGDVFNRFAMRSVGWPQMRRPQGGGYKAATAFTARSLAFPLLYLARPPHCPTRFSSGVLAVFDDLHTVHENMFHTGRVLMRFFKGGVICDRRRIEHHHVGEHSFLEKSAVIEAEIRRR